jgi:uncharacterized glyoxalase superfamily protein PhnB
MSDEIGRTLYPALRYDDPDAAVTFLTHAFGFVEHRTYRDSADRIVHAQLCLGMEPGAGMVMLGPARPGTAPPAGQDAWRVSLYAFVPDPDAHHRHAQAAGAVVIGPPSDLTRAKLVRTPWLADLGERVA